MSTFSIFAYVNVGIVINAAVFIFTLIFSQKIKDFFNGVPSHLRTGLKTVEGNLLTQVKDYEADLIAKINPSTAKKADAGPPVPPL